MKTFFAIVYFLFIQTILFAEPNFPELTGRVVDKAKILSINERQELSSLLEEHEKQTSNQIVIVTLNSLNGYDIADFGYQLGRHWGIGQKDKNNGVLLIVSMVEKKIRIEVGYGLEGALSDKRAHEIIEYILKPNFRRNEFYNGIYEASNAIIKSIKGEYKSSDYGVLSNSAESLFFIYFAIVFLSAIIGSIVRKSKKASLSKLFHSTMLGGFAGGFATVLSNSLFISAIVFILISIIIFFTTKKGSALNSKSKEAHSNNSSSNDFGGFSSSSGRSGGFSGGGGGFGGGGASGGW